MQCPFISAYDEVNIKVERIISIDWTDTVHVKETVILRNNGTLPISSRMLKIPKEFKITNIQIFDDQGKLAYLSDEVGNYTRITWWFRKPIQPGYTYTYTVEISTSRAIQFGLKRVVHEWLITSAEWPTLSLETWIKLPEGTKIISVDPTPRESYTERNREVLYYSLENIAPFSAPRVIIIYQASLVWYSWIIALGILTVALVGLGVFFVRKYLMVYPSENIIIPDTSALVNCMVINYVKERATKEKILVDVPRAAVAELEHLANQRNEKGFKGLKELESLRELANQKKVKLIFSGRRPGFQELKLAQSGGIDDMVRYMARKKKGTLLTCDKIQAMITKAEGVRVVLLESTPS